MRSQRVPAGWSTVMVAAWECFAPPPTPHLPPAWHCNKPVFSSSGVGLSAKLMIMITVHEKSIFGGEPEEKNPVEGGMGEEGWGGINLQVSCLFDQSYSAMMRVIRTS